MTTLEADYLVVGAGAMGMAFTDTLVTESDAQVVIVDWGHAPGGHWNRAYPFVRLHQPSAPTRNWKRYSASTFQTFRRLPRAATKTPNTTSTPPAARVRSSQWCMLLSA